MGKLDNNMKNFMDSYLGRDKNIEFSEWLAEHLKQEMPEMSEEACKALCLEIIEGVEKYDGTLADLNESIESGQSKEEWLAGEWLAEPPEKSCDDMSVDEIGDVLQQIENELNKANAQLLPDIEVPEIESINETVEWNEYSIKKKVSDIGQQAVMAGLGAAAGVVKHNIDAKQPVDVGSVIEEALEIGAKAIAGEVKVVVAGAIKTAAEKGLIDILPSDTPTEVICYMAGAAVECADAMFCAAAGKISMTEAMDKAARASVAAICRWGSVILKTKLTLVPVVGPVLVDFAGGLLEHMKSPKFSEDVYNVVRNTVKATWEGIKQTASSYMNKLRESALQ